ncbi:MAG TPA: YqaE/Pmp3 family membrane protein [Crocinitomix sp.]|nr:YqaE/Pmp3 family membrane protein [Crocinitomix sp.]
MDPILLYLLAFFIPPVAVGLVTDWDMGQVVLNIILWALCVIPGIIHALIVVSKNV